MIEVEVLYTNLTRKRVLLTQVDTLPKDKVLFVLVRTTKESGKRKNIIIRHGFDNYILCQREFNGQKQIMLHGWDDGDFVWRRLTNPHDIDAQTQVDMPVGCMNVIFRGQSVTDAKWLKAIEIVDKEIV